MGSKMVFQRKPKHFNGYGGPFIRRLPTPDVGSAVPSELVPGAAALLPKTPPELLEWCIPMPCPEAAPTERLT